MPQEALFHIIAKIHNGFSDKFGIPRQSGLVETVESTIVFEPRFRNPDALRGLDGYSHIWLLWQFTEAMRSEWMPTVRPPRLGGNTHMGVFATRSPFRPNPIGLSSVRLLYIDFHTTQGPVLYVAGADLMDGTPIYDIKPYLAYTDSHPEAKQGFAHGPDSEKMTVEIPLSLLEKIPSRLHETIRALLAEDPRPGYQHLPDRVYKMAFSGFEIHFTVNEQQIHVCDVRPMPTI